MNIKKNIDVYFKKTVDALERTNKDSIEKFTRVLLEIYKKKGTVYTFGNGGSGATAAHFCGDLIKGVSHGLSNRFKAICLNDNIPALMAIANDLSYEDIFYEQLKNFLEKDDLVIGFSCSGNSTNVVKAIKYAKRIGAKTVAFCGYNGGKIKKMADFVIQADINDMEVSEDIHLIICHSVKRILKIYLNAR